MTDVLKYLESKNIYYKRARNEAILKCPYCSKEKLYINVSTGLYHCFVCQAEYPESPYTKGHITYLQELWGDVLSIQTVSNKIEPNQNFNDVDFSTEVEEYHKNLLNTKKGLRYLYKRGITIDSVKKFKLGYLNKHYQDWICIPSYENRVPKLLKYRKIPPYTNEKIAKYIREEGGQSILFNVEALDKFTEIIVTEGEIEAITLLQNGYENVVGITAGAGSLLSEWYDKLIMKEKIILIFDPDSSGQTAAKETWATRLGFDKCWNVKLPDMINGKKCDINTFFQYYTKEDFDKYLESAYRYKVDGLITLDDSLYSLYLKSQDEESLLKYELPWPSLNRLLNGGLKQTRLTVLGGSPNCLSKDTHIWYNDEYITIEEAYRNYSPGCLTHSYLGNLKIGFNIIKKIVYSGQKDVYKVTTLRKNSIKTTLDHQFKTYKYLYNPNYGYKPLSKLQPGCIVCVDGPKLDILFDIEYCGKEDTYDIIMENPHRNFIANNFIVHNSGKTTMALQILYHFAKEYDIPSLMFNMEMHETSLVKKIVQLDRDLIEEEVEPSNALVYAMDLKNLPVYLGYSSKITPDVFYNTMKMARDRYGCRIGVFDNIHRLVRSDSLADMAKASGIFKDITMDLNVMFILISQPRKRSTNDVNYLPTYDDILGAGQIGHDADEVIMLHRKRMRKDDVSNTNFDPVTRVIVDKTRYSPGGMTKLYLIGEKSRFVEIEKEKQ